MQLSTAIKLIEGGILKSNSSQRWADLGAGEGLFTQALGSILPPKSLVLAIDQNVNSVKSIGWNFKSITLQTQAADFTSMNWGEKFHGIIMANALHYVLDQVDFLAKLQAKILPSGRLIIVEYERRKPNTWVPYPIDFMKLKETAEGVGFSSITKLGEVPSIYDGVAIYSAVLTL